MTPLQRKRAGIALGLLYAVHLCLLFWAFGSGRAQFHDLRFRAAGSDVRALYTAGLNATRFRPLYDAANPGVTTPTPAFRYLPATAYTVGVPIAAIPLGALRTTWLLLCELVLIVNVALCWRVARSGAAAVVAGVTWLLFTPVVVDLWLGQFSLLTASFLFWAHLNWHGRSGDSNPEHRFLRAELCWLGAVLIKAMPLLYVPALLRRGHRGTVERVVALVVGTTAVYFAVWPQEFIRFWELNFPAFPRLDGGNQGLAAALLVICGGNPAYFRTVHVAACILVWGAVLLLALSGRERCLLRSTLLWTVAFLLTFGDVWEHHYVLLLPPIAGLALRAPQGRSRSLASVAICTLLLALPNPIPYIASSADGNAWLPAVGSDRYLPAVAFHLFRPLVALALFAGLIAAAIARQTAPAEPEEQLLPFAAPSPAPDPG